MFVPGQLYKRRSIHQKLGGQRQSGISTPTREPVVLLFTGETGEQYGYNDGWTTDGTFSYSGEGQSGDMSFERGNRAIRDHISDGKTLHLFQNVGGGSVRYLGEMLCAGFHFVDGRTDYYGVPRRVIQFHLLPLLAVSSIESSVTAVPPNRQMSLNEVNASFSVEGKSSSEAKEQTLLKTNLLREIVLRRARGNCEYCGAPAPFLDSKGDPYLEIHHVWRSSDGGPDEPHRVIALCPNCHRRAHVSIDRKDFNDSVKSHIADISEL